MYCPACGTQSQKAQKYCRACGMVLDGIAEEVVQHLASIADHSQTGTAVTKRRLIRKTERAGELMGSIGLLLLITFLIVFFISLGVSKVLGFSLGVFDLLGPLVMSIALPMIFIGAGLKLYPMLSRQLSSSKREPPLVFSQADTTQELVTNLPRASMPSVTERTTRTLGYSEHKASGHS